MSTKPECQIAVVSTMSRTMVKYYPLLISVYLKIFILHDAVAQQTVPDPSIPNAENQSSIVNSIGDISTIANTIPSVLPSPILGNIPNSHPTTIKENDWWPPIEPEVTRMPTYITEIEPVSAPYYIPAPSPPPAMLSHHRSEQWSPYGYPEFGYPVIPPNPNNHIGGTPKYVAIALFIGLLTLFAIIQGSLMAAKQKEGLITVDPSREKRDLSTLTTFENMTPEQQDIFTNDAKIRCIQRTICVENQQIIKDFGPDGIKLAEYLTRSVKKSLENASGWNRLVEDAGAAGLRGENCNVLYRDCVFPPILQSHPQNN